MAVVHPLTATEVVEILDGLHARLDARPALALDPTFMGLVRLAVTANPSRVPRVEAAPAAAVKDAGGGQLLLAHGHLTDALALCADQANEIAALKADVAALRGSEANHQRVLAELEAAREAHASQAALQAEADSQVSEERMQRLRKARASGVELVRSLKSVEFSGAGSGMRHPKTKQPLPACPACRFVDPEAARGLRGVENTGHAPDCVIAAAIEQAASLVAALG